MKMWGGRFSMDMDADAWKYNASIEFDQRLGLQDVRGSIAWAKALQSAGILNTMEMDKTISGLETIQYEIESSLFEIKTSDEDIHTAVERRLEELIGPIAGKLHTGRSRNDQVATDLRLWLLYHVPYLDEAIRDFQAVLIEKAQKSKNIVIPGYTHLQRAQPVALAHWWLSFYWPLHRDRQRLAQLKDRAAVLPLGSAALAGTPYPIDRHTLSDELKFTHPCQNSIDGISDRDFVAEFLFFAALTGIHLSRFCESLVLFSTAEFGFFELDDQFATGSSLMPQKKNPDIFELSRAKSGRMLGNLTGLMAVLKSLPSSYDKDLQEDKLPLFSSYDILLSTLHVLAPATASIKVRSERIQSALDDNLFATDLADYLVRQAVPFREAHFITGQVVQLAEKKNLALNGLRIDDYQSVSPVFGHDVFRIFDPHTSISRREAFGGSGPVAVSEQIQSAKELLESV